MSAPPRMADMRYTSYEWNYTDLSRTMADVKVYGASEDLRVALMTVVMQAKTRERFEAERYELAWKIVDRVAGAIREVGIVYTEREARAIAAALNQNQNNGAWA